MKNKPNRAFKDQPQCTEKGQTGTETKTTR